MNNSFFIYLIFNSFKIGSSIYMTRNLIYILNKKTLQKGGHIVLKIHIETVDLNWHKLFK